MSKISVARSTFAFLALVVGLSACGSSSVEEVVEEAGDEVEEVVEETVEEVVEAEPETGEDTTDAQVIEEELVEGELTEEEIEDVGVLLDDDAAVEQQVAAMLGFMGLSDEESVQCVIDKADEAGVDLQVDEDAVFVAAIQCDGDAIKAALLPDAMTGIPAGVTADEEQVTCAFNGMIDWIGELGLTEADGIFAADPPDELIEELSDDCGISVEQVELLLA